MLHDPSHYEQPPVAQEIKLPQRDRDILRRLAADLAKIAAVPVHREKAELWRRLNDLDSVRPMVWINEICWHEMNVDDELTLQAEHPWARDQERDLRWLNRWGLTYYGCCEPLDRKIEVLRKILNLRKISVSPWCKTAQAVELIGDRYVASRKPSPAILAEDTWQPQRAREDLRRFMEQASGRCHVELIMKDISTVRYQPQRLWEWAAIAMEVAEEFSR